MEEREQHWRDGPDGGSGGGENPGGSGASDSGDCGGWAAAQDSILPAPSSGMWRSHDAEARRFSSSKASPPQPVGEREKRRRRWGGEKREGVCLAPR